ncbi:MAG: hypothetical protein H6666_13725 [Ardenticatenaceae bacterium]|nr:hypothetical protein [Ardenticatenaceae bacterium]
MRGGGCFATIFNIVMALVIMAILFAIVVFAAILFVPNTVYQITSGLGLPSIAGGPAEATPTLVAVAAVPTPQPTSTRGNVVPTFTPVPLPPTLPVRPTNTLRPTLPPSITPTFPPPTATSTPTETPTNTPTPGPSATASATRSPFPFTSSINSPIYLQNFANNAQCNWLGIAGEVLDLNRNPVSTGSYRVHVWGSGIDERVVVGTAPAYSPSGWEQFVHNAPAVRDYNLQLETPEGSAVSQVYAVQTRASCNENLLYFVFVQNH